MWDSAENSLALIEADCVVNTVIWSRKSGSEIEIITPRM